MAKVGKDKILSEIKSEIKSNIQTTVKKALAEITSQVGSLLQESKKTYAQVAADTISNIRKSVSDPRPAPVLESKKGVDIIDEYQDRERRKANIILHNIPEPDNDTRTEKELMDRQTFTRITEEVFNMKVKATKAIRLGRPQEDRPRLVLITLENPEVRRDILKRCKELRGIEEWERVYISPDLTQPERQRNKELRDELKRRREDGETNIMIRRGRIVSDNRRRPDDNDRNQNTTNQAAAPTGCDVQPDAVGVNNQNLGNKQHTLTATLTGGAPGDH